LVWSAVAAVWPLDAVLLQVSGAYEGDLFYATIG
jgi:hypothetical protein